MNQEVIQCPYNGTPQELVDACAIVEGQFTESSIQVVSITQEKAILELIAPKTGGLGEIRAARVASDKSIVTVTFKKNTPEVGELWAWLRTKLGILET
jgi:hypothetical protein